ncbi:MAG: hypothetical protein WC091_04615 [Sulfuricellaceae bacterium]
MMDNYLGLEPLLIARLHAAAPGFREIIGMADLASMQASRQTTPAALVIYQGDALSGGDSRAGQGAVQVVVQTWLVVVAVRNERDTLGGADARCDAGVLITRTLQALSGWQAPGFRPLVRVNAPKPGFNAGFAYFPLAFEARMITGTS